MNYLDILDCDILDGDGVRVTLFVSGCSHHCKGCQNPKSWDAFNGKEFTQDTVQKILKALDRDYIDGLTLSGGDPLFMQNRFEVTRLCKEVKKAFPNKTIWLYTGYKYEEIETLEVLNYVDVLVDGKFKLDLRDVTLAFKGSSNQRIIDVQKSLKEKEVVLYK